MAEITLGGNSTHTLGELPTTGSLIPNVKLVDADLNTVNLHDYLGEKLVISIFPSVNTGVCAASVRHFNQDAADLQGTRVLNVSMDLPFAQKQFCAAEGIERVVMLSDFRFRELGNQFKAMMTDGKFEGLLSRAVVVTDDKGKVVYSEQVPEIGQEPNYEAALNALK